MRVIAQVEFCASCRGCLLLARWALGKEGRRYHRQAKGMEAGWLAHQGRLQRGDHRYGEGD